MADNEAVEMLVDQNTSLSSEINPQQNDSSVDCESMGEDILQKALQEATNAFSDQNGVQYADQSLSSVDVPVGPSGDQVIDEDGVSLISSGQYQMVTPNHLVDMSSEANMQSSQVIQDNTQVTDQQVQQQTDARTEAINNIARATSSQIDTSAPLGTSSNPIRIIQQGNQYTSLQQLSPGQLQQIMTVLQNQHVAKDTPTKPGSSVLFNPNTNTRIVYRVMYPSDVQKKSASKIPGRRPGRPPLKRKLDEREDSPEPEPEVGPELTKEEKLARKKARPKTRSGRVSKPPRHMVKDYKHIHPVNWDEDCDDSDGGYSDYHESEDDKDDEDYTVEKEEGSEKSYSSGGMLSKPKHFKCTECEKAYVGRGGLRRHYLMFPSHGDADDVYIGDTSLNQSNNGTTTPRVSQYADMKPEKRRSKIKEFMRHFTNEEIMEVVLPQLSQIITPWEFLLMKVETAKRSGVGVSIQDIYSEFEALHEQVSKACIENLTDMDNTQQETDNKTVLVITNKKVSESLGLDNDVTYTPNTSQGSGSAVNLRYRLLTINPRESEDVQEKTAADAVTTAETEAIQQNGNSIEKSGTNDNTEGAVVDINSLDAEMLGDGSHVVQNATLQSLQNLIQTTEGIVIIQNPDGSTIQLQHDETIPLETVQALLAMEQEGSEVKFVTSTYVADEDGDNQGQVDTQSQGQSDA